VAGHNPARFLNEYLENNMNALFENPLTGELECHLCNLEYRTEADAERVVAWIRKQVTESSNGRATFDAEIFQDPESGRFWIDGTTTANGLRYPV
jgi:hypothetical protein